MRKIFEIELGVPEIWGFNGLEMILLPCVSKKEEKIPLCPTTHDIAMEKWPPRSYLMIELLAPYCHLEFRSRHM